MNILDLPDEILYFILNKISMVDVFYSLIEVNQRFDRLALDAVYTHHLNLVVQPSVKRYSSVIADQDLEQICRKILPRINSHVYKLSVAPLSLEHLGAANYPQLYSLVLVHFPTKTLSSQLTGISTNFSIVSSVGMTCIFIFQEIPCLYIFLLIKLQNFAFTVLTMQTNQPIDINQRFLQKFSLLVNN